ncbi:MAG: ATP-binding cassette domain-containing protein [Bryobacterales bacterium]|nr:ATP-binding cassette domain-containing protein [Bryobacterales bacterium]
MPEPRPILEFDRVTVSFGDTVALRELSFLVREGDSRIILGAAGSGKSVLMKTALGLIKPDEGRVKVFGEDTSKLKETQWFEVRRNLGVLFQEGGLFDSLTIEENVAYPLNNSRARKPSAAEIHSRTVEALEFVELGGTLDKVPSELSGGMRRRVGIARAMVTNPALTLYDSPTAGLDPITSYTIVALIAKERRMHNTTTMIATHRYQDGHFLANYTYNDKTHRIEPVTSDGSDTGTRFWVMHEGRFAFEGTQSELEQTTDPYVKNFVKPRIRTYGK